MRSSDVADIALDLETRAPLLGSDGAPYVIYGRAATLQLCWAAMRQARGEYFLDLDDPNDLPLVANDDVADEEAWIGSVGISAAALESQVRRCLRAVPGVVDVPSCAARVGADRETTIDAIVIVGFDDDPPRKELIRG